MRRPFVQVLLIAISLLASARVAFPQSSDTSEGEYPDTVYLGSNYEHVDVTTGRLYLDIPLLTDDSQRGDLNFSYSVVWSGMGAWEDTCYKSYTEFCYFWPAVAGWTSTPGFANKYWGPTPIMNGSLTGDNTSNFLFTNVVQSDGAAHPVGYNIGWGNWGTLTATVDGSGIQVSSPYLMDKYGRKFTVGANSDPASVTTAVADRNGNQLSIASTWTGFTQTQFEPLDDNGNPNSWTMTDTVGRTWSYAPASNTSNCPSSVGADHANIWTTPGQNGGTRTFEFCFSPINLSASFEDQYGQTDNFSSGSEYLTAIVLPDDTTWQFEYADGYGDLTKLILPTGGSVTYQYTTAAMYDGICGTPTAPPYLRTVISRTVSDGTNSNTWNYSCSLDPNPPYQPFYTATDPLGNDTVYSTQAGVRVTQYYAGSASTGTLLETVNRTYTNLGGVANPLSTTTVWPNGQSASDTLAYDPAFQYHLRSGGDYYNGSFGLVTSNTETDYGGATLRQTNTEYEWQVNSSFLNSNSLAMPYQVGVTGSGGTASVSCFFGTAQSCTTSGYDGLANLTSLTQSLNTGSSPVTQYTYNGFGMRTQVIDPTNNSPTTYGYDSSGVCVNLVTNGLNQSDHYTCDPNTEQITSHTDANGAYTSYSYDDMLRPTSISYPDSGQTTYSYPSPNEVDISQKIDNSGDSQTQATHFDGLGRATREIVSSGDSTPYDQIDLCYDGDGRVSYKSYAYQGTGLSESYACPGSEPGDTFTYDALNRTISLKHSDGSVVSTSYTGRATSASDEGNGTQSIQRITQIDGLGRVTSVCEVTSGTLPVGISGSTAPAACGQDIAATGFLTSYTYDPLENLTSISQGPLSQRTFTYDSLSRLVSSTNPESNWSPVGQASVPTTYSYDADGNLITKTEPAPNQQETAQNTMTYTYGAGNRLIGKSYSDGTPAVTYQYDQCSVNGVSFNYTVGRLCYESTGGSNPTGSVFSYDSMGRVVNNSQCTPQNCGSGLFPVNYTYDETGNVLSSTNGAGVSLSYIYNVNGNTSGERLLNLTSSLSDSNHPGTLFSNARYNASGEPVSASLGNGVTDSWGYMLRGWPQSITTNGLVVVSQATSGTGSVSISGSLQSKQVQTQAATPGTGTVTISGVERNKYIKYYNETVWDYGTVTVTINGVSSSTSYEEGSTTNTVAAGLASAINANANIDSLVSASASGSVVAITARQSGVQSNYSLSAHSATELTQYFASTSFPATASGSALTGGANAVYTTIYDSGGSTITANGHSDSVNWSGSGTTASSIASSLASAINGDSGAPVSASASGGTVSLTAKTTGASTNYSLLSSSTYDSSNFSSPSFTNSASGSSLTGGQNVGFGPGTLYSYGLTYAPDGDVLAGNDSANGNWAYSYDAMNRLVSSSQNSGAVAYAYQYDRFGNRWNQTVTAGSGSSSSLSFDANNRVVAGSGIAYDSAGNVINDGSHSYFYDAENRLIQVDGTQGNCSTATACYVYNAEGQRVRKTVNGASVDLIYDLGGHEIAEMSSSGAWNRGEIYAGGVHLATYNDGTTYFDHADWLGTERVRSGMNEQTSETCSNLPFGDGFSCTSGDTSPVHFTGYERDSETGLDNANARFYGSLAGRLISPDPAGMFAVRLAYPQTLNRYSYVLNNPLSLADPLGLDCAYLNHAGDGIESVDQNSNFDECGTTGGYWVEGTLEYAQIDANAGYVQLWGSTNGTDQTYSQWQDSTLNIGWYQDSQWNPWGHIGIGIGDNPQVGLNPASDAQWKLHALAIASPCLLTGNCLSGLINGAFGATVPGVVTPTIPKNLVQNVPIPITGMQATLIQQAINQGTSNSPPYSIGGTGPACDCGTWVQGDMAAGGMRSGAPAWDPQTLVQQLVQMYGPSR